MATRHVTSFRSFSTVLWDSLTRPSARRLGLVAVCSLALAAPLAGPSAARAQAAPPAAEPPTDGAAPKKAFEGRLTGPALVFSGAGTQFYPTMRLPAGSSVIAVGMNPKGDWLKIVPPEGSFSFVSKAAVHVHGDGSKGKVTAQTNVRAGSSLSQAKQQVQTMLKPEDDVVVLGEEAEYLRIKPPANAYLWVSRDAVQYIGRVGDGNNGAGAPPPPAPPPVAGGTPPEPTVSGGGGNTGSPTTQDTRVAAVPATQSVPAELLTRLQKLETEFSEMSKQPLVDQPVADVLGRYEELTAAPGLPEMAKRIADVRVATLKVRSETKEQFLAVQQQQRELQERLKRQSVEKEEIEARIKEIDITVYAAVGTLRTSSLQVARTRLYRLTDPESGRTVVYVWGTDPKIPELVNQFVGVKGPMQTDPRLNLKVVTPTAAEAVDPAKVNTSVAAEIVPPSLQAKAPIANTGNQ